MVVATFRRSKSSSSATNKSSTAEHTHTHQEQLGAHRNSNSNSNSSQTMPRIGRKNGVKPKYAVHLLMVLASVWSRRTATVSDAACTTRQVRQVKLVVQDILIAKKRAAATCNTAIDSLVSNSLCCVIRMVRTSQVHFHSSFLCFPD